MAIGLSNNGGANDRVLHDANMSLARHNMELQDEVDNSHASNRALHDANMSLARHNVVLRAELDQNRSFRLRAAEQSAQQQLAETQTEVNSLQK